MSHLGPMITDTHPASVGLLPVRSWPTCEIHELPVWVWYRTSDQITHVFAQEGLETDL